MILCLRDREAAVIQKVLEALIRRHRQGPDGILLVPVATLDSPGRGADAATIRSAEEAAVVMDLALEEAA